MLCKNCNTENKPTSKFCYSCGRELTNIVDLSDSVELTRSYGVTPTKKTIIIDEKPKKNQKQNLLYFGMGVLVVIVIVLSYIVLQSPKGGEQNPGLQSDQNNLNSQVNEYTPNNVAEPDSTPIKDDYIISKINDYFSVYSKCNFDGNIERYLELFTDPAFMNKKMMNKGAIRTMVSKFFIQNSTINHYFQDLTAYSKTTGEFIVYLKEHQETIRNSDSKLSNITAYKRFVLVEGNYQLVCKEMNVLSTSYN